MRNFDPCGQLGPEAAYRLVSLLEILEVKADAFCRMSSMIGQMLVMLELNQLPDTGAMGSILGELHREAQRLGLRSVDRQLERIKEHFTSTGANTTTMRPMLIELSNRMLESLADQVFLMIPAEGINYYREPMRGFGPEVETRFPLMQEDIAEAGKCLAMGRATASVFHLMRVMERAVQAFGDELGVVLTEEKNWQNILDEINKAIKQLDHKLQRTKDMAAASSHLYNVKIAWRNEVMHPKQTYTVEEATVIFSAVTAFIRDLAATI